MQFSIYMLCVGLVVVGSLSLVSALSIAGKFRLIVACLVACIPIGVAVWLFRSSGLKINDFNRLLQLTQHEIEKWVEAMRQAQTASTDFDKIMKKL